jgi:hypothetical protein
MSVQQAKQELLVDSEVLLLLAMYLGYDKGDLDLFRDQCDIEMGISDTNDWENQNVTDIFKRILNDWIAQELITVNLEKLK